MPRVARCIHPRSVHHVISRFVDRSWFFQDDDERERYLVMLGRALSRTDWRCLAYCVMSNHVHLVLVAGRLPLSAWARRVHSPFAQWMNARRGRLGPLFADRPAAHVVPPTRVPEVMAYVHNNPVRAGVVAAPEASSWSSHAAYVGKAPAPLWLDVDEGLARAGCAGDAARFAELVASRAGQLELPNLPLLRQAARRRGPVEVGTPILGEPIAVPIVARPLATLRPAALDVLEKVSARCSVPVDDVLQPYGRGSVRRVMVHAAAELGLRLSDVGVVLGVSRQRASAMLGEALDDAGRSAVADVVGAFAAKVDDLDTVPVPQRGKG
jgi:REP element-mobilizing transposase RayT